VDGHGKKSEEDEEDDNDDGDSYVLFDHFGGECSQFSVCLVGSWFLVASFPVPKRVGEVCGYI
jgi:hypothetical protein